MRRNTATNETAVLNQQLQQQQQQQLEDSPETRDVACTHQPHQPRAEFVMNFSSRLLSLVDFRQFATLFELANGRFLSKNKPDVWWHRSQELQQMLPAVMLTLAIRTEFLRLLRNKKHYY